MDTTTDGNDLYGYDVSDTDGNSIGSVDGVWVDDATNLPEFVAGGQHIHHSAWGILSLMGVGYAWLMCSGTGSGSRWGSRGTSYGYGPASALTLDEITLWLVQEDKYWKNKGWINVDSVLLFGSLLALSAAGSGFFRGTVELVRLSLDGKGEA